MDLRHHQDPREFLALAAPFYGKDTVRHTLALTVIARTLGMDRAFEPVLATCHENGDLVGVAFRTPPWPLISSGLPTDSRRLDDVVPAWLAIDPQVPGVTGPRENAGAVADAWARHTGGSVREVMVTRLFQLGTLVLPAAGGTGRLATPEDAELMIRWRGDFQAEAHGHLQVPDELPAMVRRLFEVGDPTIIWEDRGDPVAMATASAPVGGMSRVGPVYVPPEHRNRGYGSAVTAAVTRAAQQAGVRDLLLFTDVTNPTSNSIYQKIGYRPVYDSAEIEFSRLPSTM
jgi:GNAT superfamily N-acetyltransferase